MRVKIQTLAEALGWCGCVHAADLGLRAPVTWDRVLVEGVITVVLGLVGLWMWGHE